MAYKDLEKKKETRKAYWEKNKEQLREKTKERIANQTEEDKEKYRNTRNIWRENNKEEVNRKRKERKKNHRDYLVNMLGGKCVGCGTTENLQFDHIDRHEKSFCLGKSLANKLDKLIEEAKKCQLLCDSCHRIKTSINHDANCLAEGKRVIDIQIIGNKTIVTLEQVSL
jgi:hypothetical protein